MKRSVITIKNDDTLCAARAVVTAIASLHRELYTESQIKNGFNASRGLQLREAQDLHNRTGVPIRPNGNTFEDLMSTSNVRLMCLMAYRSIISYFSIQSIKLGTQVIGYTSLRLMVIMMLSPTWGVSCERRTTVMTARRLSNLCRVTNALTNFLPVSPT